MIHRPGDRAEMVGFDSFMDHSCEPSTHQVYVTEDTYTVFAARDLKAGEELTCDHTKLENQAIGNAPSLGTAEFRCRCGAPSCRGIIVH